MLELTEPRRKGHHQAASQRVVGVVVGDGPVQQEWREPKQVGVRAVMPAHVIPEARHAEAARMTSRRSCMAAYVRLALPDAWKLGHGE